MSKDSELNRREFLKAGTGLAALSGISFITNAERVFGANDRVRVGMIGPGDRGRSLIHEFHLYSKELNMEMVAVCDIWNRARDRGAQVVEKLGGNKPKLARNTDELYEMKDVDAVIISTADFQHAYHLREAVQNKKDAYCEKPLAHTMEEAKKTLTAVQASQQVVQIGTQRRSSMTYQNAAKFLQSGKLGDLKFVEITWNVNQPKRWRRAQDVAEIRQEDTDWKRFLLDLPDAPWDPRKYLEFRLFWPYSSGIPDQWLVHQIDTVAWFTQRPYPKSCVASGEVYMWHDGRTNPDCWTAVYDWGTFQVFYTSRMFNSLGGIKEIFCSNQGAIDLDRNVITGEGGLTAEHALDHKDHRLKEEPIPSEGKLPTSATFELKEAPHMKNWMECIRSRNEPNAPITAGYQHSVALCMGIVATQTGKRVGFDEAKQELVVS